jgi:hypothetical protein
MVGHLFEGAVMTAFKSVYAGMARCAYSLNIAAQGIDNVHAELLRSVCCCCCNELHTEHTYGHDRGATATIVLVLVAIVICVLLVYWAAGFGMMFFYYSLDPDDRQRNIYESNEYNCKDLSCI